MKRIVAILITVAIAVTAAAVSAEGNTKVPQKSRSAALFDEIGKQIVENGSVYLYFHAESYESSIGNSVDVEKLAKSEKAGFFVINVEDPTLKPLWDIYSIMFVPTVVKLERGAGAVEKFEGPKSVKALKAGRKKKKRNEHIDRIAKNSEKGTATLLEFYAEWCSPCLEMMPTLEEAEEKSDGRLDVMRIHVERDSTMRQLYNVDSPPANILVDTNGVPRLRTRLISSPEILTKLLDDVSLKKEIK